MSPKQKRTTPFQKAHASQYALEIVARDLKGEVDSAQCLLCVYYGRADREGEQVKRRRTENVKIWSVPFRPENCRTHHENQHRSERVEYQKLSATDKKAFFDKRKKGTIQEFVGKSVEALKFTICGPIVEVLIGELFFHPAEDEEDEDSTPITKADAMQLFVKQDDGSYVVTIKNRLRFNLALDHTAVGLSFRQTSRVIDQHRHQTKNERLAGLNDHIVGQFVRILVVVNLNTISNVLSQPQVWAFSIAGDWSTHWGVSFFDVRICLCVAGVLYNLHLVLLPFFDRHTAVNIVTLISKLLDTLFVSWRDKLFSVSSDGENTMTGRHSGVQSLLEQQATNSILRIVCVPYQWDLVIKKVTQEMDDENFYKTAHAFSVHLRAQANLITEMKSKCPKDTTRWLAFGKLLDWMLDKRICLLEHCCEKHASVSLT
jgi:hypothetical protein